MGPRRALTCSGSVTGTPRLSLLVAVQPAALERTSPASNRRPRTATGSLGLLPRWLLYSVPAFVNLHDYYSIRIHGCACQEEIPPTTVARRFARVAAWLSARDSSSKSPKPGTCFRRSSSWRSLPTDTIPTSAALAAYLHAAYSSDQIAKLPPDQELAISYFVTGFFLHVANSLDSLALWLAGACDIMQSARVRPSLTGDDFLARLALIDAAAQTRLKSDRPWMEEAQAYRWLARCRNSLLWTSESGEIVISSTTIRSSKTPLLGDISRRSSKCAPAGKLCADYLARLASVSRTVFEAGAPRLTQKQTRQTQRTSRPARGRRARR